MSARAPSAEPIISGIIEQHADEAAFLWTARDHIVYAPHVTSADLARHDERLEAHLDGLRVAGDAGWAACRAALDAGEPGALFVAAVIAFDGGQVPRLRDVLTAAARRLGWSLAMKKALIRSPPTAPGITRLKTLPMKPSRIASRR